MLKLNRDEAKDFIHNHSKEYCEKYFGKDKTGKGYICPICSSGSGKNGTGITTKDGERFTCWAGNCFTNADLIDIIGQQQGLTDYNEKIKAAAEAFGIEIVNTPYSSASDPKPKPKPKARKPEPKEEPEKKANFAEYIKKAKESLKNSPAAQSYLQGRGLTEETIDRFNLGYESKYSAIVIPYNAENSYYITRAIKEVSKDKRYWKPTTEEAGSEPIFNEQAIYNTKGKPVFVCEAQFCAISIMQEGAEAIALGGTGQRKLIELLKQRPTKNSFILCLDNDEKGRENSEKLGESLRDLKVNFIKYNIARNKKDPNEALTENEQIFKGNIKDAEEALKKPYNIKEYLNKSFIKNVEDMFDKKDIKTGFPLLDRKLSGLYSGLYTIGAISSLGKTTFMLQIADQLAAAGNDVLFFSLEQSRFELASKSIARYTVKDLKDEEKQDKAISALTIRKASFSDKEDFTRVKKSIEKYINEVGSHLSVIEGNYGTTVKTIKEITEAYIAQNKVKPIIIVDYLQVIQAAAQSKRASLREELDIIVTELKRLSRNNDLVVFIISSLNRMNYTMPVDFESFKETGGIEYTSDVVLGLQLQVTSHLPADNTSDKREKIRKAKAENPRKIELVCLKNRYGISGFKLGYDYYPALDLFIEDPNYME